VVLDGLKFLFTGSPTDYARLTKKSCWEILYTDGRIFREWQRDWSELPYSGRSKLRLYTPTGIYTELGSNKDNSGRFIQLKVAIASLGIGGVGSNTFAHMIGYIHGFNGEMTCRVWDYKAGKLLGFEDNAYNCRWEQLGPLAVDHLGIVSA
jgi:hypothetical protein